MALDVIGAGFGRTGTTSLRQALETLGLVKCHHMIEVMRNREQAAGWLALATGGLADWDELLAGYRAAVDFPSCIFYRELMAHYPDAKVILSIRDADSWYRSASETIYALSKAMPRWLVWVSPRLRVQARMIDRLIWDGVFQGRFEDPDFAKEIFRKHIEDVKSIVPPERLLVYEISEGWGPLCRFLGVQEPAEPFPRTNESKEVKKFVKVAKLIDKLPHTVLLVVLGWLVYLYTASAHVTLF